MTVWPIFAIAALAQAGTVIDQIAIVVGKHAIKTSDIDRDLRITAFLNGESASFSPQEKKNSGQRLIDQELIREDIAQRGNTSPMTADAQAVLDKLAADRYGGSKEQMRADVMRRGLTEKQVLEQVQWQMVVLRFIDQRFRPGVSVNDEQIAKYYQQHTAELKREHPGSGTLDALTPDIREQLEGEQINQAFDDWLAQARQTASIQYKLDELK